VLATPSVRATCAASSIIQFTTLETCRSCGRPAICAARVSVVIRSTGRDDCMLYTTPTLQQSISSFFMPPRRQSVSRPLICSVATHPGLSGTSRILCPASLAVPGEPYPRRQLSRISGNTQHTSRICLNVSDTGISRRSSVSLSVALASDFIIILVPICLYCLNCTKFGQFILRKIIKIVATRCHILRLKCTKFDFGYRASSQTPGELTALPQIG